MHIVDSCLDFRIAGIIAHVDDERLTVRLQNAIHFNQSADRITEVFERRAANHEIEAIVREWECCGVTLSELDLNS